MEISLKIQKTFFTLSILLTPFFTGSAEKKNSTYTQEQNSVAYTKISARPGYCKTAYFGSALWLLRQLLVDYEQNKWLLTGVFGSLNPTGGFAKCLEILNREGLKDKPQDVKKRGELAKKLFKLNKALSPKGGYPYIGKMIAGLIDFAMEETPKNKLDFDLIGLGGQEVTIRQAKTLLMAITNPLTGDLIDNKDYLAFVYKSFISDPAEFVQAYNNVNESAVARCDLNNLSNCMSKADKACKQKDPKYFAAYVFDAVGETRLVKTLDGYLASGKTYAVHPDKISKIFPDYGDAFCVSKVLKQNYKEGVPFVLLR
ncbi:MAG: hypothetical protein CMM87_04195 [Rickettsiales bacterium]|nr:hypothetical protein [Rickettsiales bacterium]|tara:strand:+ start:14727 stop:15668 length:942 start_codon:yes stop_codon:yes gene_type:complete